MKRLVKKEGFGNVQLVEDNVPVPGKGEFLVKLTRSLISRGSELFRRYVREEAVDPQIMGYSAVGRVAELGPETAGIETGQRVVVTAPHAQFELSTLYGDRRRAFPLPDSISDEEATFLHLAAESLMWMRSTPVAETDTVVVLGQGIIGALCAQTVRERQPARVIAVDLLPLRCEISAKLGADIVVDGSKVDPVETVLQLTDGASADVVVECVGGPAGVKSFAMAQKILKRGGIIQLVARYQGEPLPLDATSLAGGMVLFGDRLNHTYRECKQDAAAMIVDGRLRVRELITHRLPWQEVADAYHFLYQHPEEALGVILEWE